MSWAEIKKAVNSNIDVSLDRYLSSTGQLITLPVNVSPYFVSPEQETELINVQGTGYVKCFYFNQSFVNGDHLDIQIIVDDEIFAKGDLTVGSSYSYVTIGVVVVDNVVASSNYSVYLPCLSGDYNTANDKWLNTTKIYGVTVKDSNLQGLSTDISTSTNNRYSVGAYLTSPLFFNKSFVVKLKNIGSTTLTISDNYNGRSCICLI